MDCPLRAGFATFCALVSLNAMTLVAKEPPLSETDNQPFVTMFVSSLSRFRTVCEVIYQSVDRQDLYDSMDSRLTRYNEFAGIDSEKPLGIMFVWGKTSTPYIVFLPVTEIDDLLKTSTFGAVGFHQVGTGHYEIERRQKPWQVLVRKDYALIVDSASTVHELRTAPEQITRNLRDQFDGAVHFDFRHIPQADKRERMKSLRMVIEPLLQCGDDEAPQSGRLRKGIGVLLLNAIERLCMDTRTLTIGIRLSPDDGGLHLDVELDAVPKSALANTCNRYSVRKNRFSSFLQSDAEASGVAVFKLMGLQRLVEETLDTSDKSTTGNSQVDIVMQLVGDREGDISLVTGFNGADVNTIKASLCSLLKFATKAEQVETWDDESESYIAMNLRQLIPTLLPKAVTRWTGASPIMMLGDGNQTAWFGIGSPENLTDDLTDAIECADESTSDSTVVPVAQAKIKGRILSDVIASHPLIPNTDAARVREELSRGKDGVTLKVEPIANGMRLKVDFEAGFVRLMGRDWTRQVEAGAYLR